MTALVAALVAAAALEPQLVLTVTPELGTRRVSFRDRVTETLPAYQSGAVGLARVGLEVYPAQGRGLPLVSSVGFTASASRSLRVQTQFADGSAAFAELWHAWAVGARWRGVFAGEERVAVSLQYGSMSSLLSGVSAAALLLPSGVQQFWRPGLELRQRVGPISLTLSGGYLAVVVKDALGRAFPRSSEGGVDVGLAGELALTAQLSLRLEGRYTRFFYSLHPFPGDPWVAGGALDETATAGLGLALRL